MPALGPGLTPVLTKLLAKFDEHILSAQLQQLLTAANIEPRKFIVGFSGGLDSSSLLLALSTLRDKLDAPIVALHFEHGLHPDAKRWREHCGDICAQLDIPFEAISGTVAAKSGIGTEAAARNFRYQQLENILRDDDVYLTAHHASDQAETLLLNLLRGSGPLGLAAIPAVRGLGAGWVVRPLLNIQRAALEAWIQDRGMDWVDDPSNSDETFDRNFLRHRVIPLLQERWPAATASLHRSAALSRTESAAMAALLVAELDRMGADQCTLPIAALLDNPLFLRANILRQWVQVHTGSTLPYRQLQEFLGQLGDAGGATSPDHQPELQWAQWLLKKYQGRLWLQDTGALQACPDEAWAGAVDIHLGDGLGHLEIKGENPVVPATWSIGPRRDGGRMVIHAGGPRRKIKHLMNEVAIPTWMRRCIPVLYRGDTPLAVGDWHLAPEFSDWLGAQPARFRWIPENPALVRMRSDCHKF